MAQMKDSGVAWIGEIPSEWRIVRIKNIYHERTELSENGTEKLLSVSEYYGVAPTADKNVDAEYLTRAESLIGYKKCYKNDFVSNIMLAWKGSFGTTEHDGIVSPAYCVYKPIDAISPRYYHYLFRTDLYKSRFKIYSKGIIESRLRLYSPYFYMVDAIFPSFSEQQSIVSFLDKKCGEIDSLIALQEEMIGELQAYKQSVITGAVTKGLDPNAKMKDSGVEWIGEIPIHWQFSKMKNWIQITNGSDPKLEGDIPVYGSGTTSFKTCGEYKEGPTVLIGRKGAIQVPSWIEGRYWNVDTAFDTRVKDNFNLRYFYYIAVIFDYKRFMSQTTLPSMTQTGYGNAFIPVPPLSEQQAIATYLDEKTAQIDSLISIKQEKIAELKDYKKSIIYEYVTGKKRV